MFYGRYGFVIAIFFDDIFKSVKIETHKNKHFSFMFPLHQMPKARVAIWLFSGL